MKKWKLTPERLPSEHVEQIGIVKWVQLRRYTLPELDMLYAIPNGGRRDAITGAQLKAEGVKRGVPDLCLPVARGGFHGLYIELKRRTGGVVSEHQQQWIEQLRSQGYKAEVAHGASEAIQIIEQYLNLKPIFERKAS